MNVTFSRDRDDDQIPCFEWIGYTTVTYNRSSGNYSSAQTVDRIPLDAAYDCRDASQPNPLGGASDADDDLVPDVSEEDVCDQQDATTGIDGTCSDLDTNYHPPDAYSLVLDPEI